MLNYLLLGGKYCKLQAVNSDSLGTKLVYRALFLLFLTFAVFTLGNQLTGTDPMSCLAGLVSNSIANTFCWNLGMISCLNVLSVY